MYLQVEAWQVQCHGVPRYVQASVETELTAENFQKGTLSV